MAQGMHAQPTSREMPAGLELGYSFPDYALIVQARAALALYGRQDAELLAQGRP